MRKIDAGGLLLAAALAVGLTVFTPALRAQDPSPSTSPSTQDPSSQPPSTTQEPSAQTPSHDPTAQTPSQDQTAQTFTGKIAKNKKSDQLVLKDMATKTEYMLDDQEKAKSFQGKTVKITGTLDAQSNTIHISDIQPAGSSTSGPSS